ncbi:PDZ domain-containing protein [Victivallaceae bacterium BBE-744-WT-12]|uniref:PDZ domain-containing protein n=1 Tax=Victivallis lenta TaxID=2606640 RepID=A0A844G1E5_9BACT|nr:site-2 protease family protein [Victivallis lenta]MST96725.1 PDZ domain-containing protein [Victivallis lenta]
MDWILDILSVVFVFVAIGFCIFSHELGHFLAAKWRGLHIDAFSLGFKPFWRKKINGVEYRLGWLPFGGYVELPQVDATDAIPKAADGTELPRAKPLDRIITAVAGPLFNILSGLLIACFVWWVGLPQDTPKMRELSVLTVDEAGPEWQAGLRPGDRIVKINGEPFFATWREIILNKILFTVGAVELDVIRDGKPVKISYVPAENPNAPRQLKAEKIAWPFFSVLIPIDMHPAPGSPAEKAGVKEGDVLVAVNGEPVSDFAAYQAEIDISGSEGKPVALTLRRGKETVELSVLPAPLRDLAEQYSIYRIGVRFNPAATEDGLVVIGTEAGYPAEKAGILAGDRIRKLNGAAVPDYDTFLTALAARKGEPSTIELERDGKTLEVTVSPLMIYPHTIGAELAMLDHPTPLQQFYNTFEMSRKSLIGILVGLGNKLGLTEQTSSLKPSHMSGPLGMGMVLFTSVRHSSFVSAVYFMVIISFALAIFNLFPLPVLDGGHITFGLIEIIFRRPLPTVVIKGLSTVFVVLLIGLMVYVTFSDGRRLLRNTGLISVDADTPQPAAAAAENSAGAKAEAADGSVTSK